MIRLKLLLLALLLILNSCYNRPVELYSSYGNMPYKDCRTPSYLGYKGKTAFAKISDKVVDNLKLGRSYLQQGKLMEADKPFNHALSLSKRYLGDQCSLTKTTEDFIRKAHLNYGDPSISVDYKASFEHYSLDDQKKINEINNNIKTAPNDPNNYYKRGLLYMKHDDFSNAMDDYSKAIKLNKEFADAYAQRADLLFWWKKDIKKAEQDYSKAINYNTAINGVYAGRAYCRLFQGKHMQAYKDFEKAKALVDQKDETLVKNYQIEIEKLKKILGKRIYEDKDKMDFESIKHRAITGNAKAQYNMGLIYDNGQHGVTQNHLRAFEWFKKAAEQGLPEAQYNLGLMYGKGQGYYEKDQRKALRWFKKAADQGLPEAKKVLQGYGKM